jgi:hypothetical protein
MGQGPEISRRANLVGTISDSRPGVALMVFSVVPEAELDGLCARGVREVSRMTEQNTTDAMGPTPRRFDVELFIIHPLLDPADISRALGMEGHFSRRVGDQRKTPKGTLLPGVYPDTRWRHSIRRTVTEQWFASEVVAFVGRLEPHKEFLANVRATGGSATVIIQFLGDGYLADDIPLTTLAKLGELGLSLGIECFIDPQS